MNTLPHALDPKTELWTQIGEKKPTVFLDYDGTLTPIVGTPDQALLDPRTRSILQKLSKITVVGILSGRLRTNVEALVQIPELYYGGTHGFDIRGPGIEKTPKEVLPILPIIETAYETLKKETQDIPGCLVENKKFGASLHYRLVDPSYHARLEALIDRLAEAQPSLKKSAGKMVWELRPNLDWDKGKALLYLMEALRVDGPEYLPIFLGDDVTDEDAFRVLQHRGWGILVNPNPKNTLARAYLKSTEETQQFLERLVQALA